MWIFPEVCEEDAGEEGGEGGDVAEGRPGVRQQQDVVLQSTRNIWKIKDSEIIRYYAMQRECIHNSKQNFC